MNAETIKRGLAGGILGGIVMAMWSMIVLWLTGVGFWAPLNFIAHTLWRGAPLDATFSFGVVVLGMVVHMMMSMVLGVVLAVIVHNVHQLGGTRGALVGTGMVFGLVVWLVMQYIVWRVVDTSAAAAFTPWVFALGHLMYGAATAAVLPLASPRGHGAAAPAT
ncbi:hypothetical protein GCM10012275_36970 [Longimycelium tulufanense]|uniref:Uncharacterized protein n=1 Tax=Longimycelium tulufanense TaxID=907463 RepID=A0A8J3CFX4_9PSEU|nr:hypothetical protein [Longimycelium tulufanense]GGM62881.1 hypothetical protein GCM10012275_36970 [Longimycelium tulufanense]